jgi:hypothetical protein
MDSETLKIILKLQEENMLLKRAFDECRVLLSEGTPPIGEYDSPEVRMFMRQLFDHVYPVTYLDRNGNQTDRAFDEGGNPNTPKRLNYPKNRKG